MGELIWLEYISKQIKLPLEDVKKRVRVQYWKDEIEVFDLGVFVPFLEAGHARELRLSGLGIVYERSQQGVEPRAHQWDKVRIYTYDHYFRIILLAEYSDEFTIVDSSGSVVQLSDRQREMYVRKRDSFLTAAKMKPRD